MVGSLIQCIKQGLRNVLCSWFDSATWCVLLGWKHNTMTLFPIVIAGSWVALHAGVPTKNLKIDEKETLNIC